MLSLFPQLFAYQELAPFILRLVIGFIAISFGYSGLFKSSERLRFTIGIVYFCAGILLFAGFFTQLAAGLVSIAAIVELFRSSFGKNYQFFILFIAALIALMLLGPGLFSIDLPL